jgi:oligopeptide/dipeptide ABC transporter ATP-binding protein
MIAMALSCGPKLLVADEPTTALDVTTQAQVLEQIVKLQSEFGMAMILVTHDLGVVAETCSQALVMYCGSVVENAPVNELFAHPRHPYTTGLLNSIPRPQLGRQSELPVIPGMVPDLRELPEGCRFAERCDKAADICRQQRPELEALTGSNAEVACHDPN